MNIYKTYLSHGDKKISLNTISSYIECLENAFSKWLFAVFIFLFFHILF